MIRALVQWYGLTLIVAIWLLGVALLVDDSIEHTRREGWPT